MRRFKLFLKSSSDNHNNTPLDSSLVKIANIITWFDFRCLFKPSKVYNISLVEKLDQNPACTANVKKNEIDVSGTATVRKQSRPEKPKIERVISKCIYLLHQKIVYFIFCFCNVMMDINGILWNTFSRDGK